MDVRTYSFGERLCRSYKSGPTRVNADISVLDSTNSMMDKAQNKGKRSTKKKA